VQFKEKNRKGYKTSFGVKSPKVNLTLILYWEGSGNILFRRFRYLYYGDDSGGVSLE